MISAIKVERGLALQDLLAGAYEYMEGIELKPHARIYLLDYLATTELALPQSYVPKTNCDCRHRLSTGASEKIQLTALLGAFKNVVELLAK